ncbi:MAG: 50S ribosomal protein L11 methyltransferase [Deltaproteobacteria bacterium]|jgi:ribosomal protein L11 methyltransferase|nr:50S ribosomal protein L11 methyltransferase [Deltaproteobacteria bacterium]
MTKRWLEIRLLVPEDVVDLVSQVLVELGSSGVITADCPAEILSLNEPTALQSEQELRAFFEYPDDPGALCLEIRKRLKALVRYVPGFVVPELLWSELTNEDWASNWKQYFPPLRIGQDLVICPSWISRPEASNEKILTLDPGQAFGTGQHATTSLCLDAMASLYSSNCIPRRVLDVGTGSGILAMVASALGSDEVVACDIDPEACMVARQNFNLNGLVEHITVTQGPLDKISGNFDLVLANILAAENIRLAKSLVCHLDKDGLLILSGILIDQETQVAEEFGRFPLDLIGISHRQEWSCMVYQRQEENA